METPQDQHTVLIVDDTPEHLALVSLLLRHAGFHIITASDGQEGLQVARRERPDLVVSDVVMPNVSGIELCRMIRADEELHATPVLLVSALDKNTENVVEALQTGADGYIEVPFEPSLLVAKVVRLLERKHSEAQLERRVAERTAQLATANQMLRESEEKYRNIVETAKEGIWLIDNDVCTTYVNQQMAQMLGYTVEEMIGRPAFDFIFNGDVSKAEEKIAVRAQGTSESDEFRLRRKDGSAIEALYSASPIKNQEGAITGSLSMVIDITERKLGEEALRKSEARYRRLIDTTYEGVLIFDCEMRITYVNQRLAEMLNVNAEELIGTSAQEFVTETSREDVEQRWQYRAEGVKEQYDLRLQRRDGSDLWVIVSATPVYDEHEEFTGTLSMLTDITERKQSEEALRESEERLQQSQKMEAIGTLAGGVAHDFNNLLTVILGNVQLAFRGLQLGDPMQLRLVEVEKAANRATVLTRQLLAFGRRQHLERRTINLNDTIGEIMKLLRRIIGEDVEVNVKAGPNLSVIFADPAQIEQVIMNLAVNARDAMPQGGRLSIETSNVTLDESYQRRYPYVQPGKYVQVSVSDTGTGIDPETRGRIFEPFFTTKEVDKGTGLGLSMVYGIIKQHDGHIHVYSEVGHGTTFKVYLPVVESAVEKEALAIQLPLLGGTETILVAEDEEALRNLARDVLEGLGYTVFMATNGEEAVTMYEQNREQIDMLLLDVVMPRMGGSEAFERIREQGGDLPLIFMTGYSAELVQSRFVKHSKSMEELDAVVLQKPYNVEGLGRKVREVLDKSWQKK